MIYQSIFFWVVSLVQDKYHYPGPRHYDDVIMGAMASYITSLNIVYSTVYSAADQRKHQSSASLAFVRGIHRWLVNSPRKRPVTRKMFPFEDVIRKSKFENMEEICRSSYWNDSTTVVSCAEDFCYHFIRKLYLIQHIPSNLIYVVKIGSGVPLGFCLLIYLAHAYPGTTRLSRGNPGAHWLFCGRRQLYLGQWLQYRGPFHKLMCAGRNLKIKL